MAQAGMRQAQEIRRLEQILKILRREYPEAECSLVHKNAFELLCATILSAQCTDARVNIVTPSLFKKYPTPEAMAKAKIVDLEKLIRTTGFYKNKAKSLQLASRDIVKLHQGRVPDTLEKLVALQGVGRKTANVVLGVAYGTPGLVVDTHVGRLARRMGFTDETDPVKVEIALMKIVPRAEWTEFGHLMIAHGRAVCQARSPKCDVCPISSYCPKVL
jgi:endonuclease-3